MSDFSTQNIEHNNLEPVGDQTDSYVNSNALDQTGYADLDFQINLEFFSGPMDLLLHLVSQREVPIENVCLKEVLDQYLELVMQQAEHLDLEKASEYLVIAATLMVIKSKALIPQNAEDVEEVDETPEYSRFFEDLRAQLIAFENTRIRAQALIESPQLDVDTFVRRDKNAIVVPPEMIAEGEEVSRLGKLFLALVKRVGGVNRTMNISIEPISIVSYMMKLVDSLKVQTIGGGQTLLSVAARLFRSGNISGDNENPRNIVLGSFIAILELAKRGLVKISQEDESSELKLELSMTDSDDTNFKSEFDDNSEDELEMNQKAAV